MRTIIFDFDNTLVEYKQTCVELHAKAADRIGLRKATEAEFARYAGMPWDYMLSKVWPGTDPKAFKEEYHKTSRKRMQTEGAREAVEELSKSNALCVLSSKSRDSILIQLKEAGIPESFFRLISAPEEGGPSKPDPRAFDALMGRLGNAKRTDLLYVGDSTVDAFAAAAAGIPFIGVLTGWNSREDFNKIGAYDVIPSVKELPQYLNSQPELSSVEEALEDIKAGKFVIVLDDAKRENEADLTLAAMHATPEKTAFMIRNTSGILCTPASSGILDRLGLFPVVEKNTDRFQTPFTVSVDSKKCEGSGVSAKDRCTTIRAIADGGSGAGDFGRPGHVFPLRPNAKGVLARRGHTEAAVDLMRLAGLTEAAAIGELMDEDGKMLRGKNLSEFAKAHGIRMIRIEDIATYRKKNEKLLVKEASAALPTSLGTFSLSVYTNTVDGTQIIVLIKGEPAGKSALVRVHSECLTGEAFFSGRCDCRAQLSAAMSRMEEEGAGVIVYLHQEGRGIGLTDKIRAYSLQDKGLDTVEANLELGLKHDTREYWMAAQVLKDLGVKRARLLTNNRKKATSLEDNGIRIDEIIPLRTEPNEFNGDYIGTKKLKLGHTL